MGERLCSGRLISKLKVCASMYRNIKVFWEALEEKKKSPRQNWWQAYGIYSQWTKIILKTNESAEFNINGGNFEKKIHSLNIEFWFC